MVSWKKIVSSPTKPVKPVEQVLSLQRLQRLQNRGGIVDHTKSAVGHTIQYSEEAQGKRQAWLQFAWAQGLDTSMVDVTNTGINIKNVANFALSDDEPTTYNALNGSWELENLPNKLVWENFCKFLSRFTQLQRSTFLEQVMGMKEDMYFLNTSTHTADVQMFHITEQKISFVWYDRDKDWSVRRLMK